MTTPHLLLTGYALGCVYLAVELWIAPLVSDPLDNPSHSNPEISDAIGIGGGADLLHDGKRN